MKIKQFDCIEMKRIGSQKIYDYIKTMNMEDELTYWQQATQELEIIQNQHNKAYNPHVNSLENENM